jgi:hypothetical protein
MMLETIRLRTACGCTGTVEIDEDSDECIRCLLWRRTPLTKCEEDYTSLGIRLLMERRFERTTRRDEEGLVLFDEIVLPPSMLRELGRRASPALADLLTPEEAKRLLCEGCDEGLIPCKDSGGMPCPYRAYGSKPLASARFCIGLWTLAQEEKEQQDGND